MREIKYIVVHCSAGNQHNTATDIVNYHIKVKGWRKPGYHFIIEADGTVVNVHPVEQSSNGVNTTVNPVAINVCYIGGVDTSKKGLPPIDNRTPQQKQALLKILKELKKHFPKAKICSHRDFAAKACPSFDATKEYENL